MIVIRILIWGLIARAFFVLPGYAYTGRVHLSWYYNLHI